MQVSLERLTQAMQKVRKFAEGQKNVPGVMFDINGDKMKVCYSDGKKSIIETIDVLPGESNITGQIVVPYVRMMSIIDSCQPSGQVYTGDFDIAFGEGNTMVVTAIKKVKVLPKQVDGMADSGAEPDPEEKVVSKFGQRITYNKPEESIQYQVLSRMDYNSIFEGEDADSWAKEDLKKVLSRISIEKNKTAYISSTKKAAFVSNLAHVTNIPITACEKHGMSISTNVAGALVEILSKTPGDTVTVYVKDNRYASIRSEDMTVGVWFELAPASKNEVATLQRYQERNYTKYQMAFLRAALMNVISCAMASDNNEKTNISMISDDTGKIGIRISSNSGGASMANDFTVIMEMCKDNSEEKNIMELKVPVSLKVLYDMLNNCEKDFIAFDIAQDDGGTYIRIGDIESIGPDGAPVLATTHYTVSTK